jgi:hypothetical protein
LRQQNPKTIRVLLLLCLSTTISHLNLCSGSGGQAKRGMVCTNWIRGFPLLRKLLAALLLFSVAAIAQEGHPLDGTWRAERILGDGTHQTTVLIMQWDGKTISGTINPGPGSTDFTAAELTPAGWKLTLSAKTTKGADIRFIGAISDLGKYHRAITGTWTQGAESYDLRFVRE